jgi:2,3-bisphosphoglycerate-dependent phosphoglycerate mutase
MKHFYLLRHTEFENTDVYRGRLPVTLTPKGKKHAQKIAEWFADKKISKIYSSIVERCKETSEIIAAKIKAPVAFDKRLLEIMTAVQGIDYDVYKKDRNIRFSEVDTLGGETMRDVQVRMLDCFYEISRSEKGNVIICSHGDGLFFLYLALVGKEIPDDVREFDSGEYPKKGTVRQVDINGEKIQVHRLLQL